MVMTSEVGNGIGMGHDPEISGHDPEGIAVWKLHPPAHDP